MDTVTRLILENEEAIVVYLREEKNLEEAHGSGAFAIDNPGLTATTISGMMSWVALWFTPGGHWSETEVISTLIHNVSRIVLTKDDTDRPGTGHGAGAGRTP